MIGLLLKLLPLAAAGMAVTNADKLGIDSLKAFTDMSNMSKLQDHLKIIADAVLTDYVLNQKYPETNSFPAYCREVCTMKDGSDAATDPWGAPITLYVNQKEQYFEVFSKGPDGTEETEDDVFVQRVIK